ncbi:MAG: 4-demethylwyosine synthase TYW1 [Candidatus Thermoplasmatota archaeon]
MPIDESLRTILERQGYRVVGRHSGVKLCHWLGERLLRGRCCYKEDFYGIRSHRCLQMTPSLNHCTQTCLFCWRYQGRSERAITDPDDPKEILDGMIAAHRKLITGYKGDPRCPPALWEEAWKPRHVAISLSGEPMLYEHLGALIEECHRRGMTTFLVTNGTCPETLERLEPLPTQLYVTVAAPNEAIYKRLCVPVIEKGWERLQSSLALLPSLSTRRVIRHTLVRGWNMGHEDAYARLDMTAEPDFIEPKGYVFVGYSRERMTLGNMPSHAEVRAFSRELAKRTGFEVVDEKEDSRVCLLSSHSKGSKIEGIGDA